MAAFYLCSHNLWESQIHLFLASLDSAVLANIIHGANVHKLPAIFFSAKYFDECTAYANYDANVELLLNT